MFTTIKIQIVTTGKIKKQKYINEITKNNQMNKNKTKIKNRIKNNKNKNSSKTIKRTTLKGGKM